MKIADDDELFAEITSARVLLRSVHNSMDDTMRSRRPRCSTCCFTAPIFLRNWG